MSGLPFRTTQQPFDDPEEKSVIVNPDALSILFVDDESNLLNAIARHFRRQYNVFTATNGHEALGLIRQHGPFPIIVSDMKMPNMNGIELLSRVRTMAPDTVRILLTGQADLKDAIRSINEGSIFRFLTKPCSLGTLAQTLDAARTQYELVTSQRILLEQTLQGSIRMLTDILALTNPTAFGKANRARQLVEELLPHIDLEGADRWPIEVAAMLSQIGYVTLPPELAKTLYMGGDLTDEETAQVAKLPEITESLLAHIPRIETVREILRYRMHRFDGKSHPEDGLKGRQLPLGARILKLVLDFDTYVSQIRYLEPALDRLFKDKNAYDIRLLNVFAELKRSTAQHEQVETLQPYQLRNGMIFATDIVSTSGHLLVARGQEVTDSLRERILLLAENGAIESALTMLIPPEPKPEDTLSPEDEARDDDEGDASVATTDGPADEATIETSEAL